MDELIHILNEILDIATMGIKIFIVAMTIFYAIALVIPGIEPERSMERIITKLQQFVNYTKLISRK